MSGPDLPRDGRGSGPGAGGRHDPVAIVGAGPVGMTAALFLGRHGVPSVVLEAEERSLGEGSRSICVQKDVLDLFDRLGCGQAMADRGVSWTLGRTYFRDVELFQIRFPEVGRDAFPPFVNLPQAMLEEYLHERVRAEPLIDLRWSHRVESVSQDAGGVRLGAATPGGPVEIAAPYAIGCDGPRSAMRRLLGVEFPGESFDDSFLIVDVRADLPFANERRFFFDPPFNPGRQVLVHPQPDGVWRIDWQLPAGVDVEEERATGELDRRIRAVVGEVDYEIVWLSTYRFHQRVAASFRAGRIFLAGDAAHLMSPFGARGLNSGVADAENLAWKLWLVLAGRAPEELLDTYDAERRAAAEENVAITGATMRFMVPATRLHRLVRNAVLRGSLRLPRLRRLVNSGKLSAPFVYTGSPIVVGAASAAAAAVRVGAVAPDGPCGLAEPASPEGAAAAGLSLGTGTVADAGTSPPGDGGPSPTRHGGPAARAGATPRAKGVHRVRQLFGDGFVALYLAANAKDAAAFAGGALERRPLAPLDLYVVVGADQPRPVLPSGASALVDTEGLLDEVYGGAGSLALIRPDGHLAAWRAGANPGDLADLVDRASGSHLGAAARRAVPTGGAAATDG